MIVVGRERKWENGMRAEGKLCLMVSCILAFCASHRENVLVGTEMKNEILFAKSRVGGE
jgi:hypothetical protein